LKPVHWVGSSKRDLLGFTSDAVRQVGFCLSLAQGGDKAINAVPLIGFGGAGVLEIIVDDDGDTFRTVYTVNFEDMIYVLHAFKKKSKSGRATPRRDMALVRSRLKVAQDDYDRRQRNKEFERKSATSTGQ
jgi:phage-related protein